MITGMLASVANLAEARLAAAGGADIVDLKNPVAGALGALLVIVGAAWLMPALGVIAAGGFLLAIDRRIG